MITCLHPAGNLWFQWQWCHCKIKTLPKQLCSKSLPIDVDSLRFACEHGTGISHFCFETYLCVDKKDDLDPPQIEIWAGNPSLGPVSFLFREGLNTCISATDKIIFLEDSPHHTFCRLWRITNREQFHMLPRLWSLHGECQRGTPCMLTGKNPWVSSIFSL